MTKRGTAERRDAEAVDGLLLTIEQIKPYERDPRHSPNAEYARIKASIRATGMDQPLVVTQRPGESAYLVAAGGNTRLRILRELYAETGDARFCAVACVYRPWSGEADVLFAHLRENDLRGDLSFIDKARAVRDARGLIEAEAGCVTPTQGELTEILKVRGYALSQASISNMDYAVDILLPLLPSALGAGLSAKEVRRIRALERAARAVWSARAVDTAAEFDAVFATLCHRYDGPDWDLQSLRGAVEAELAERMERSIHAVRLMLEGELTGAPPDDFVVPEAEDWPVSESSDEVSDVSDATTTRSDPVVPIEIRSRTDERAAAPGSAPSTPGAQPAPRTSAAETASAPPTLESNSATLNAAAGGSPAVDGTSVRDLPALRAEALRLATGIASRHGLGELILPLLDNGTGFLVREVPDPALLEQLDEPTLAQISMLWWQLVACAEVTVAPLAALLPLLAESSVLHRALSSQDAGLLFGGVWTLDPGQTGYRLWRTLADRDWSDLLALMGCYRAIHRAAETSAVPLWRMCG